MLLHSILTLILWAWEGGFYYCPSLHMQETEAQESQETSEISQAF